MQTVTIYCLIDPRTDQIRYIGKTKGSLNRRLSLHLYECKRYNTKKTNWIKSLKSVNLKPQIEVLDIVPEQNWVIFEQYWIQQFRAWGYNLVNMTDGGDGNYNQVFSEESKQKKNEKLRNVPRPEDVKLKISKGHLGKKLSDTTKEKLRIINTGKRYSLESKLKKSKSVSQFTLEGTLVKVWNSLSDAANFTGASRGAIQNCCVNRAKTAKGFIWKYTTEDIV